MARFRYVDPEDIDGDPFAKRKDGDDEFSRLLAEEANIPVAARRYRVGDQVTGRVVSVGVDNIFIDLGGKTTGSLAIEDLRASGQLTMPQVDEEFTAYVRQDTGSELILTRSLRRSDASDDLLERAYEQHLPVDGKVEKVINGGYEVTVGNKRAFCPFSGMDKQRGNDPETYVGSVLRFHIQTFAKGRNLVLSRREIVAEEQEEAKRDVLSGIEVGQSRRAIITRIAIFGAFADLGGVDGLIPMSELSWTRVKSAADVVKVGDAVQVRVLKVEHAPKLRISLSLKDAGEDPWIIASQRLIPGDWLDGEIAKISTKGVHVRVSQGVEGLVPVRELTWDSVQGDAADLVTIGETVKAFILEANAEEQHLVLSLRGPMPKALLTSLEARKRAGGTLTPAEENLLSESEKFHKIIAKMPKSAGREESSALAAAFTQAKRKH